MSNEELIGSLVYGLRVSSKSRVDSAWRELFNGGFDVYLDNLLVSNCEISDYKSFKVLRVSGVIGDYLKTVSLLGLHGFQKKNSVYFKREVNYDGNSVILSVPNSEPAYLFVSYNDIYCFNILTLRRSVSRNNTKQLRELVRIISDSKL